MKSTLRTFLAGVVVVVPFAITLYIIWIVGSWLATVGGGLMHGLLAPWTPKDQPLLTKWGLDFSPLVGGVIVLALIYVTGLLTKWWFFSLALQWLEGLLNRVPGVKTVYESVRDLLKVFGGSSKAMGKAALYRPPGLGVTLLGIVTNEHPGGMEGVGQNDFVAMYLPLAYMIGGPIVYVPRSQVQFIDLPIERVLKLCATAEISPSKERQATSE